MEINAAKKTLQDLLIQLITECNWNTTSPERHVSKIVVAAYWDGIPEAIRNEIKALGPDAEKYLQTGQRVQKFKTIAEELDHYETAEIRKAVDGILLDERTLKQAGIKSQHPLNRSVLAGIDRSSMHN
jgi:phosphoglycolate phosphatase-like HAD superfamily hydrolase